MGICGICTREFMPDKPKQIVCGVDCALIAGRALNKAEIEKERKKQDKIKKIQSQPITHFKKLAQTDFNAYIRVRDQHKSCVSCHKPPHRGQRHASHYRPRSTAAQLSFNTGNVWASCATCNSVLSGNLTNYRRELVERIGESRVIDLENNNNIASFSREYLIRLRQVFIKKRKHLIKLRAVIGEY